MAEADIAIIHIHEPERVAGVGIEGFEGTAGHAETLAGYHDDRDDGLSFSMVGQGSPPDPARPGKARRPGFN
jgi:hypothetical protein